MFSEAAYRDYVDDDGKINTYKAYIQDLISHHTYPVLVAEFGIPTSRGVTHTNPITGYNQGGVTETEQGEMLASMAEDIYESGYCGGLIFAWQDEWFKRTWNTMDYSNSDRRALWNDLQTSEQNFGIMAFEEKIYRENVVLDGKTDEWKMEDLLSESKNNFVYVRKDAKYLYLMLKGNDINENKRIVMPIDVTSASGSMEYDGINFDRAVDFVIDMQGKENSKILVQSYYDRYAFLYKDKDEQLDIEGYTQSDTNIFHPIYLCLNRDLYFPEENKYQPYQRFDTGKMIYGSNDKNCEYYNTNADFYYGDNCVEIRIPWLMLNFRDPSTKEIEDDFHETGELSGIRIDGIWIGAWLETENIGMKEFSWYDWDYLDYTSRLKDSYWILKETYAHLGKDLQQ